EKRDLIRLQQERANALASTVTLVLQHSVDQLQAPEAEGLSPIEVENALAPVRLDPDVAGAAYFDSRGREVADVGFVRFSLSRRAFEEARDGVYFSSLY